MKIKKAILTGGGRATRLRPITATINKHLLPLANRPMIFHAIEKVVAAGITDIFINTNPGDTEFAAHVGDGGHWGVNITYFEQTGGPQGIAHVVYEAKKFIGDDPFIFYLSDNILLADLGAMAREFEQGNYDCLLALAEVPDPERFGVPVFDNQEQLIDVLEKPAVAPSPYAVTGIYLYGPKIFFDTWPKIAKSARGEYEISSIHSTFLQEGKKVGYKKITGWWKDTGKPEDLLLANELLLKELGEDNVRLGAGVTVGPGTQLVGPVVIGDQCTLANCTIGPFVSIGNGCTIRQAAIQHSIILGNTTIDAPLRLTRSIIGRGVRIISDVEAEQQRMIVGDQTMIEL